MENRCIYNIDKDVLDVQSVNIEYESGAVANFMLNFHAMGPRASRNFHAVGTQGRIWGNLHDAQVHLYRNGPGKEEIFDASGDGSGHGGGDALHAYSKSRSWRFGWGYTGGWRQFAKASIEVAIRRLQ